MCQCGLQLVVAECAAPGRREGPCGHACACDITASVNDRRNDPSARTSGTQANDRPDTRRSHRDAPPPGVADMTSEPDWSLEHGRDHMIVIEHVRSLKAHCAWEDEHCADGRMCGAPISVRVSGARRKTRRAGRPGVSGIISDGVVDKHRSPRRHCETAGGMCGWCCRPFSWTEEARTHH